MRESLGFTKSMAGQIIEDARKHCGYSQRTLGERMDLSARWIREIESGYGGVPYERHLECSEVLGIPVSVILAPLIVEKGGVYPKLLVQGELQLVADGLLRAMLTERMRTMEKMARRDSRGPTRQRPAQQRLL